MSEALLSQHISQIIYWENEAIKHRYGGEPWIGLQLLRTVGSLLYKGESHEILDTLDADIKRINAEASTISELGSDVTRIKRNELRDNLAETIWDIRLSQLRDYKMRSGYYLAFNPEWRFHDPSGGRKSE